MGKREHLNHCSAGFHSTNALYFLNTFCKSVCWSCNNISMATYVINLFTAMSSTLATSYKELTHWKRLWCWEGLGAGGKGDDRGWDGWMASPTRWMWVWVNSGRWWWTGRPGVLRFMESQRVGHDWATELNWTDCHALSLPSCLACICFACFQKKYVNMYPIY